MPHPASHATSATVVTVTVDHHTQCAILAFSYNDDIIAIIKKIPGRWWHPDKRQWTIPLRPDLRPFLTNLFDGFAHCTFCDEAPIREQERQVHCGTPSPSLHHDRALLKLENHIITRRLSTNTRRNYIRSFRHFLSFINKPPEAATDEDVSAYLLTCAKNNARSAPFQKMATCAIAYYYKNVLNRPIKKTVLLRPRSSQTLPSILNTKEVACLLGATENLKHRAILSIIYSGGLRRSEAVNLRIADLDFDRKLIRLRNAKGKKDRYTLLSDKAAALVREYLAVYQPSTLLFPGQNGGLYSTNSIQQFFTKTLKKTGIQKEATPHSLRHAFATHLIDQGVSLRIVQELLGHSSPKTTQIYTHVTLKTLENVKSPLDGLDI